LCAERAESLRAEGAPVNSKAKRSAPSVWNARAWSSEKRRSSRGRSKERGYDDSRYSRTPEHMALCLAQIPMPAANASRLRRHLPSYCTLLDGLYWRVAPNP
jgi:hypothetical protein